MSHRKIGQRAWLLARSLTHSLRPVIVCDIYREREREGKDTAAHAHARMAMSDLLISPIVLLDSVWAVPQPNSQRILNTTTTTQAGCSRS